MLKELNPVWVDTAEGVREVVLERAGSLALDTEADSLHSYFHKTCLIQVTADEVHYVIDPLALDRSELESLWGVVEDPETPVFMHGSDYDIRVLDRDYSVRIRGLVDTQVMAQLIGEPKTGLAALLDKEFGVTLDKRHQRADWGRRPLTASQIAYAAADTAYLEALSTRLTERLASLGRGEWAGEEFRRLEGIRHRAAEEDPLAFERVKGVRGLRGGARDRAFALFRWRDSEARRLDIPPFKVLGNKPLLELAEKAPPDKNRMAGVAGLGPRFVRRWGAAVSKILERPDRAPDRRRKPRKADLAPVVVRRVKRLAAARDEVAAELGIEPGVICPRARIVAVASRSPRCQSQIDLEEAGLEGWRGKVLGPRFLTALADE